MSLFRSVKEGSNRFSRTDCNNMINRRIDNYIKQRRNYFLVPWGLSNIDAHVENLKYEFSEKEWCYNYYKRYMEPKIKKILLEKISKEFYTPSTRKKYKVPITNRIRTIPRLFKKTRKRRVQFKNEPEIITELNDAEFFEYVSEYIKMLSREIMNIYKENKMIKIKDFVNRNMRGHFADCDNYGVRSGCNIESFDFITRSGTSNILNIAEFGDMTIGEYLILASLYSLRFVSAQDRENRVCLTKSGPYKEDSSKEISSRVDNPIVNDKPGKLYIESYNLMPVNTKYTGVDFYEKNKRINIPNPGLKNILQKILENDYDSIVENVEKMINPSDDVESSYYFENIVAGNPSNGASRKMQVILYDLIQQIAYNKLYEEKKIDPKMFDYIFNNFKERRSKQISKLINELSLNDRNTMTIGFLQEYNDDYSKNIGENNIENNKLTKSTNRLTLIKEDDKSKKGSASAIFTRFGALKKIEDKDIENVKPENKAKEWDIVAGTIDINDYIKLLLFSIHTPSTGIDSGEIIEKCFDFFEAYKKKGLCTNMIIGIDANVKSEETKRTFVSAVLSREGKFAYFPNPIDRSNKDIANSSYEDVLTQILEREKVEKTSSGERTFGLQSQFSKAGESIENYIDFIILAGDNVRVIESKKWNKGILNKNNMSDHAPRQTTIAIDYQDKGENRYKKSITMKIVSFNVAGPNSNILEYILDTNKNIRQMAGKRRANKSKSHKTQKRRNKKRTNKNNSQKTKKRKYSV